MYLLVYVDDILVAGNSKPAIATILRLLAERFSVKDPEDLNYLLGLEAHRTNKDCIFLSVNTYLTCSTNMTW